MQINNLLKTMDISDKYNIEKKPLNSNNGLSFSGFLKEGLEKVNDLQIESNNMKEKMILGEIDNLHDVSIASEKASIALQVTMSIRTKIVEAYKDIIRLQI